MGESNKIIVSEVERELSYLVIRLVENALSIFGNFQLQ